jgi:hypothetical protein
MTMMMRMQHALRMAYRFWMVLVLFLTAQNLLNGRNLWRGLIEGAVTVCLPGAIHWALTGRRPAL